MAVGTAIASAVAVGTSAVMRGVRGKRDRKRQQKQWDAEFNESRRRFNQESAANERQRAWERAWGNKLNKLNAQQGRQQVKLGDQEVRTNAIEQQIHRNEIAKQQRAAQNFTLGQARAMSNTRTPRRMGA